MAKKDKGKGIPKTIAGMKVPKALRKGFASSLLENPKAREIMADVIMAAAGAAAAALVKNRPSGQQDAGGAALDAGAGAAAAARDAVQGAAAGVAEGARQILPSSMTGSGDEDPGKDKEAFAHLAGDDDRKGKKDKHRHKPSKH